MSLAIFQPQDTLWDRFLNHAQLGLSPVCLPHRKNYIEGLGDLLLWPMEKLPELICEKMKEPRVITVALTALSWIANTFLFYPFDTWLKAKEFIHWLPLPTLPELRFPGYVATCVMIVGFGLRAFGRFSNANLMREFYRQIPPSSIFQPIDIRA